MSEVRESYGTNDPLLKKPSYVDCDILKAKVKLNASIPDSFYVAARGIQFIHTSKRSKILKDLLPLMPASRRSLIWMNLPNSDSCADLLGAAAADD